MAARVFKRIRKGAYEADGILLLRAHWINDTWDGPREMFRRWQVFRRGSFIESRVLLDAFRTRGEAQRFASKLIGRL